jgi:hypothetical protein
MKKIIFYIVFLFSISSVMAQAKIEDAFYCQYDIDIFNDKMKLAAENDYSRTPVSEVVHLIGKSFIGTKYQANTLEVGKKENLVIFLDGLDCYTLVESSLAFARLIKKNKNTIEDFLREVEILRYRNGMMSEYPSRLHYFSDWIYDMSKRKIGKDITKELGGVLYNKKINFMSTHPDSYKQLKSNKKFVGEIASIEKNISSRKYYYIPQAEIDKAESKIESGDLIGITTNINGLDISHTGIAVKMENGKVHLLHAPNVGSAVQITEKPLSQYIQGNKKQTGIMVLRPIEP